MSDFLNQAGFEPSQAVALAALLIGIAFGALSENGQFCLLGGIREARSGQGRSRLAAFGVAVLASLSITQVAVSLGLADLTGSVYLSSSTSLGAVAAGGLLFGIGAVMTRGCAGRLTVLAPTGNLRALVVILVLGVAAYATMRGILAPLRLRIEAVGKPAGAVVDLLTGVGAAGEWPHLLVAFAALAAALALVPVAGARRGVASLGIGLAVALGWVVSTQLGDDGFDKVQPWSAAFVSPLGNGLVYLMTYTGSKVDFGIAFAAGVVLGAFTSARIAGRVKLQSFESPRQTLRYIVGAILMGFGGVLALGCTTGQGLSGISTLAPASLVALAAMAGGMWLGLVFETRYVVAVGTVSHASTG